MNNAEAPKPQRRFRIRLLDRAAETIKRREAEQAAARAKEQKPVKDLVGYNPYGRTRHTVRFAPGERGRIDPPTLGGDKLQSKDPFGGVGRRRG
jgi:hypothetical protein